LGLDLKGGTRLLLQAMPTETVKTITPDVMDSLQLVIEKRVNKLGVSEALVQQAGQQRLLIEIPGITNPTLAKKQLGKVGELAFKRKQANGTWQSVGLGGSNLSKSDLGTLQNGEWIVNFEFNAEGAKTFGELTAEMAPRHEQLGVFFDGELVSAPAVNTPILEGAGYIEGHFTRDEAKTMVDTLNAGALPVGIEVIEESSVGALLGEAALQQSLMAGSIGLVLVLLFMGVYYKRLGMVANLALISYAVLSYALFQVLGVTFTLAGIAGFILSVGMAVDANILIFERTKEELLAGKALGRALQLGFDRALPSILDSNTTTLITCALLWCLGTGSVKGFALTLAAGVGMSMFTALFVTQTLLQLILGMNRKEKMSFAKVS
jgi:preprotein translocase subunit SecD